MSPASWLGAAAVTLALGLDFSCETAVGAEFAFEVRETAGIRRRSDVVTARLPWPQEADRDAQFRLLCMGDPVPAQFSRVEQRDGSTELVVDFIGHFAPFESRQYVLVQIKEHTDSPEEPPGGLQLVESSETFTISSGGVVNWSIRKDLRGLLDFSWKDTDYIADDSVGMFFVSSDGAKHQLAERQPTRVALERSGPIACSLRWEFDDWPPGAASRVELEFVRTKSWVHAAWTIDRPPQDLEQIGAGLNLQLDGPESLVDFGGGDYVYATVTRDQTARLEGGPRESDHVPWQVLHGPRDQMTPVAEASRRFKTPVVHGWAHLMDKRRCTALAIADFGEANADAISVDGEGALSWTRQLSRQRASSGSSQRLEFWLHFVTMPVHIGARTSPRSMQEPLEVRWPAE